MAGNALAEAGGPSQQAAPPDPLEALKQMTGMTIDSAPALDKAMRMLWQKSPTDDVGAMLDEISKRTGVPPPWAGGAGQGGGGGGPEVSDNEIDAAQDTLRRRGDSFGRLYSRTNDPPEATPPFTPNRAVGKQYINQDITDPMERYQALRNRRGNALAQ